MNSAANQEINSLSSMALGREHVIVGVDTHKAEHMAVAIDGLGGRLGELLFPANPVGSAALVSWATELGMVTRYGVEGTGSYGSGLARSLRRQGYPVVEIARDTAVKAHTQAIMTLKCALVTADDSLRAELEPMSDFQLIQACAALESDDEIGQPDTAMRHVLRSLARRWLELHEEIKLHSKHLKQLTKAVAPQLVAAFGIGPDIAAELLVTAGDNADRVHSEAALAKLCGACPIPASSGQTNGRHRLNRGGNRQANAALFRAVVVRMRWHPPTIAYVQRRRAEGLSKKEIIRCLKRYVAREIYRLLPQPGSSVTTAASA